jgi:hypothetical protein
MLDLIHRSYEADESFRSLDFMVHTRLWGSQVILQILLGTLVPLAILAATQLWTFSGKTRRVLYPTACVMTLVGIFAMRWNVVIGGQLFSKSFLHRQNPPRTSASGGGGFALHFLECDLQIDRMLKPAVAVLAQAAADDLLKVGRYAFRGLGKRRGILLDDGVEDGDLRIA